jgi:small-conductance mechanosensitive channel
MNLHIHHYHHFPDAVEVVSVLQSIKGDLKKIMADQAKIDELTDRLVALVNSEKAEIAVLAGKVQHLIDVVKEFVAAPGADVSKLEAAVTDAETSLATPVKAIEDAVDAEVAEIPTSPAPTEPAPPETPVGGPEPVSGE